MADPDKVRLQHSDDPPQVNDAPGPHPSTDPLPADTLDINVEGRDLASAQDGFGQLWRKRFQVRLAGADISPTEVIRIWRERFGEFWPEESRFYRPLSGLKPGEVALADIEMVAGSRLSTGVIVVDVSPTSFTFVTPEGHTFAGHISFSAHEENDATVAQVEVLMRASDPLFEIGMPLGGHARENAFWRQTLTKLALHFGVEAEPQQQMELLDRHRQWGNATNIVNNSYLHTAAYMATRPFRMLFERLKARRSTT